MASGAPAGRPIPTRTRALTGLSCAYSAIATNERAPASAAATLMASTLTSRWRRAPLARIRHGPQRDQQILVLAGLWTGAAGADGGGLSVPA